MRTRVVSRSGSAQMVAVAVRPSVCGMRMSMRTMSGLWMRGDVDGFFAVGGFVDDFEVGAGVDQDAEGRPEQGLVVGEQHTDGHGVRSSSGVACTAADPLVTSQPPPAR